VTRRRSAAAARATRESSAPARATSRVAEPQVPARASDPRVRAACAGLLLLTLVAYATVLRNGFVGWDDMTYVAENPHVLGGLSPAGLAWAFTSREQANWHPLTWLSHMLDVSLFGVAPWGHHLTSLLLHLTNTALLFAALRRLTRAPWPSLAVAALFALHPLHVESVASLGERKDVLSTTFWFAALWAYARYAERRSAPSYALVAVFFGLGLLAKPMLVSLPLTLLILDAWPLRRARQPAEMWPLVVEKLPLFAMSVASAVITWLAQRSYGGAMQQTPLAIRAATAVIGYFGYLQKTLWPSGLAAFYPYRPQPAAAEVLLKAVALALLTVAVVRFGRRHPWLPAGWAWYLVTLVPVIGLVRIGQQEMADRYTYVPLVGVFVMLAWGVADVVAHARPRTPARGIAVAAAVIVAGTLAVCTARVAATWHDGVTLWGRALAVGGNSTVIQNNLGVGLQQAGRLPEAEAHYVEAIRLEPRHQRAWRNLGNVRFAQGRYAGAIEAYDAALRLDPADDQAQAALAKAQYDLANAAWRAGRLDAAIAAYRDAVRLRPGDAGFHRALGMALAQQGHTGEAVGELRRSLAIEPANAAARELLARLQVAPATAASRQR